MNDDNSESLNKLLSSIFFSNKNNNEYKVIKNTTRIPELLSMLNSSVVSIEIKLNIVTILKNTFSSIRHYMEIVIRYYITSDDNKHINLYLILLNQYLLYIDTDADEGDEGREREGNYSTLLYTQTIITLLEILIANVTCPIEVFEYIYDLFKPYRSKERNNENTQILNSKRFNTYLNLLTIIYGKLERTVASQYFYFSGQGEMMVSFGESCLNSNKILNFEEPFAIFTWFRIGINKNDMKSTFSKSECHLIRIIQSNQNKIDITLDLNNSLRTSSNSDLSVELSEHKWYMLTMAFSPLDNSVEVKIYINGQQKSLKANQLNKRNSISSISLFKNFIGEVTTIFIVKGKKYQNLFSVFQNRRFKFGVNSEKGLVILNKTLQNDAYINHPTDYVQNIVRINQKKDFPSIKDFALLYMPNRFEEESDIVLKIRHPSIEARIEMSALNLNGVHIHKRHSKDISMIKGLYNLLPLGEMIGISFTSSHPYPLLSNVLLNQDIINEFFILIGVIKGNLSKNKSARELINFIRILPLFLEKIPRELYSATMFEYLKLLIISKDFTIIENKETVSFVNEMTINIFLNKIIYFKFDTELQEKIWNIIETYSITNKGSSITMDPICQILMEYDKERNSKYCCVEHAKSLNATQNNIEIKISDTKAKVKPIANVVNLIINNNPVEVKLFYGLLTREASPCLQTFIITVTASLFEKKNLRNSLTSGNLLKCLKENQLFINVSLFILSSALFEVRYELMVLIFLITQKDHSMQFTHRQTLFIQNNVTPVSMVIKKEKLQTQKSIKSVQHQEEETKLLLIEQEGLIEELKEIHEEVIQGEGNSNLVSNIENQIESSIQTTNDIINTAEMDNQPNIIIINDSKPRLSKEEIEELKQLYFPQSLNQDSGMARIKGYQHITLKDDEEFLSEYLNETDFKETLNKMFVYLFFKFTEQSSKSLLVSCLLKISPLLDLASNTTFINILNNQESSYIQSLSDNREFHHWLLETMFQGCIAKDPQLKGALKRTKNQLISDIDPLIKNGLSVHTILCLHNIYLLDYFLQWSGYYRKLYENDGQYNQCLCRFICLVISEVFSAISNEVNELHNPNKCIRTQQFLYSFSIFFEFLTIFQIGKFFDLYRKSTTSDKCTIDVPHYYSSLFKNTLDESKKDLSDKWENYILFKTITAKCCLIWHEKINYSQIEKYVHDSKHSSQSDMFNNQLKLLTYKEELPDKITNKGIPLIVILSNLMATMINEIETEADLDYWLQVYSQFLIFIIISSTKIIQSDDSYGIIQDYAKDSIAFGLCFLVNQYYKKKITIALSNKIFSVIKTIFTLIHKIIKKINDDISKEKAPTKSRLTFSKASNKQLNYKPNECAIFKISCSITMFDQLFFKCYKSQMSDNELKGLLDDSVFKQAIPENSKFKDIIDSIFTFNDIWSRRKEQVKTIMPLYLTYCSYISSNPPSIRLDTNYIESEYYDEMKTNLILISNLRNEIDKKLLLYQRKCLFNSQQLSLKYSKLKTMLFTFKGLWSQKHLFFDKKQELKYKVLNHLTKDCTKPLLIPIVDYDYYLPPFSKFDKKDLFFEKNKDHSLVEIDTQKYFTFAKEDNANINHHHHNTPNDKIVTQNKQIERGHNNDDDNKSNLIQNELKDSLSQSKSDSSTNLIRRINKRCFENLEKPPLIEDSDLFCEFISQNLQFSFFNPELKQSETDKPIPCCYIKSAYHVKGYFANDSQGILFYAYDWKVLPNFDFYDYERSNCYGSLYKTQVEQKRNQFKAIPYNTIERIFIRKALYIQSSIEVYTIDKKTYLFQFWSQDKKDIALSNIKAHIKKEAIKTKTKELGYDNCSNLLSINGSISLSDSLSLLTKYSQWVEWKISTLELIMYLNIMANRSYNDLSQYPVFPWILTDYSSQIIDLPLRDFSRPMGMLEILPESIARKKNYIYHYESMLDDKKQRETEDEPYVFGTHYSNSMYSCYYLMRLFPFANIKVELQGNSFDNPNRLFNALDSSFYCAITQKSDLRELIPEFFCLPEMFRNINDFDFGEIEVGKTNEMRRIQSVTLPPWCNNDPYQFIEKHRRFLESKEASKVIPAWFDITFGTKQKVVKEIYNLFREETYEDFEEKYKALSFIDKGYMCRMLEFGVTPFQIFYKDFKPRNNFNEMQEDDIELSEMVKYPIVMKCNLLSIAEEKNSFIIQSLKRHKKILLVTETTVYAMKLKQKIKEKEKEKEKGKEDKDKEKEKNIEKSIEKSIEKEKKEFIYEPTAVFSLQEDHLVTPIANEKKNNIIVTFNKGRCLIRGGYLNGQICAQYSYKANTQCLYYTQEDMSPIILLSIDQEEKFIFCGTRCGLIHIYFISQKDYSIQLNLHKTIDDHHDAITAIHCNSQLNVFASASSDGYIMLYTMPKCKLFNSIKVPTTSYISYLFVSSSPLPCFVYYDHTMYKWVSYSINGEHLNSIEIHRDVAHAKFFTDKLFMDHIVYSTEKVTLELMSLPFLKMVRKKEGFNNAINFDISSDKWASIVLDLHNEEMYISYFKH